MKGRWTAAAAGEAAEGEDVSASVGMEPVEADRVARVALVMILHSENPVSEAE